MNLADYTLLFEDDFDTLNLTSGSANGWNTEYHYGDRFLNSEQQIYVDPDYDDAGLNPFSVGDGVLTITAQKAPSNITAPSDKFSWSADDTYTSGLLNSEGMFSVQYGYFEISAQMPEGNGLWPAFWLLQSNGEWPSEYDIVEVLGKSPDYLYASAHGTDDNGDHVTDSTVSTAFDSSDGFHTYGFDWQEDSIIWYYDGVKVFESENTVDDQSMYLLLNLAVGGWAGSPDDSAFPAEMKIDYVRVYQKNVDHNVVGVPSGWDEIPISVFSELSDFDGMSGYISYNYSAVLPNDYAVGKMSGDWPHELFGNAQDNYIQGADGKFNHLDGRGGNDVLEGGDGADYFVLRNGGGNDTILDFSNETGNADKLYLQGFHFSHFDDVLPYMTQAGDDAVFRLDEDQAALLKNVRIENLSAEQFIFVDSIDAPMDAPVVTYVDGDVPSGSIDFSSLSLSSHSNQDSAPGEILANGSRLEINGNSWKSIDFEYTVSDNSILEFTFSSDTRGEIHGIALDNDNSYHTDRVINIYGTQSWGQDGPDYIGDGVAQSFIINLSDYYAVGTTYSNMVFVTDDDASAAAQSVFSDVRVFEKDILSPKSDIIDFSSLSLSLSSHSNQDSAPGEILANGSRLEINGNSWKSIDFEYTVSDNSILEFTFSSDTRGEIHGIALDNDNSYHTDRVINIYGTQSWGQDGPDYIGDGVAQSFIINLSDYYAVGTTYSNMVFVTDDDASAAAQSVFSDVRVFESNGLYGDAFDNIVSGTSRSDFLYGDDGADIFLFESMNAFDAVDTMGDFDQPEGDVLDVSDLLTGYDPLSDAISDFVQITNNGSDSVLSIDRDGGANDFVAVANILGNVGLNDEAALEFNGVLITA